MGLGDKKDSSMLELENMQRELEGKFSPLSNRRKLGVLWPSVKYWYPNLSDSDAVCSLDMVRLKLRFQGDKSGVELDEMAATFPCEGYQCWTARVKPGGWRVLHTFSIGDSSVTLGVGLMSSSCSIDMAVGFLEFNPNKVAGSDGFAILWLKIRRYVLRAELVRYDLAVDVPVKRDLVHLAKDNRMYDCKVSAAVTEYLGVRNSGGYVKVYDKQAESSLDEPLTRIELTCSGDWSLERLGKKWPRVYRPSADAGKLTGTLGEFVGLARAALESGLSIEPYLAGLHKDTRRKVRKALEGDLVVFPVQGAAMVMLQACAWAELLSVE